MTNEVSIEQLQSVGKHVDSLSELLIQVVEDGASIGFLPPMMHSEAIAYWNQVVSPEVILFVAKMDDRIIGSVQLHLCTKQNGGHRAEIAKLMTHPDYRRKGIGRNLMEQAARRATDEGRTLLVLDTREGDPSNDLYTSLGYLEAGRIPDYAKSASGKLDATVFYFKKLI
ncbi:GNAT family N-acetyltransferase [Paenibacillus sp. GSMTC-2017]|uniref:GNAT family N-acetyltransferase n=1 Tax=Paenibacillus sp. GSMTC-2017 TaxID=2794350 RepID=UPI0018D849CB|nr:GNAT family N-acetyltransferase [Paenibacillus sp. GSMTC-2017]MBH5318977.1 GNAT family N-acetyltransferase [Paenibacillus sp. GSMTC-2017]